MIYVGIDVAKDKHDCCILGSEADKLYSVFTIPNNKAGFDELYEKIFSVTDDKTEIKVGLEATGHYSLNLLGLLIDKGLPTCVINPLHTNLYRKGLSLRKTKIVVVSVWIAYDGLYWNGCIARMKVKRLFCCQAPTIAKT